MRKFLFFTVLLLSKIAAAGIDCTLVSYDSRLGTDDSKSITAVEFELKLAHEKMTKLEAGDFIAYTAVQPAGGFRVDVTDKKGRMLAAGEIISNGFLNVFDSNGKQIAHVFCERGYR